ncbi:hypothetical protein RchiOBHm_Chr6g0256401 [Rosa chinensis]|uniref:Uncharacterized protein n=1 Tax=Rosa chinensis TaxID=74649 RepID=A0A2P6PM71_ROSCH|nr:hypothetical protein RchiOBHm_Chr6g0256401 [Rosa chinensis]
MNIGTITKLFGAGENECSIILLWTNVFALVSPTLWSAFFMWFVARQVWNSYKGSRFNHI